MARDIEIESALSVLQKFYFSAKKPRRFVDGIALSTRKPNANADSFIANGMQFNLPTPFLLNHDWDRPLGRIVGIETWGDFVHFKAEIGNDMPWTDGIWNEIVAQTLTAVSIEGSSLSDPIVDRTFTRWHLNEISLTEEGADAGARLRRAWEKAPVVYSDGRPTESVFWSRP